MAAMTALPPVSVAAEVVAYPERLEAVAGAVELAPGIGFCVARLAIPGKGIHRPIAVGPYVQRIRLPGLGAMTRVGIDLHHRPQLARAGRTGRRLDIREGLAAQL